MSTPIDLRGMTIVSFWADDLRAARDWYTRLLGIEPYFQRPDANNPAYIEFRIGDDEDELGIIDRRFAPPRAAAAGPGGAVLFWHVHDIDAALSAVIEMGATVYEPKTPREAGYVTASVVDPFGNVLGLCYSPHFIETQALKARG
jgi:predicted enzyme related to lactoylglutathione lyase